MVKEGLMSNIIDDTMKSISLKVACMEVRNTQLADNSFPNPLFLMVEVRGDYQMRIVLKTDKSVLSKISETMKHQENMDNNEVNIYAAEYFNILCGHIVASFNKIHHTRTRFSVPKVDANYEDDELNKDGVLHQSDYECDYGFLRIQIIRMD